MLILTLLFMMWEVMQMIAQGYSYFNDIWNYLDFGGYILFLIHCLLILMGEDHEN